MEVSLVLVSIVIPVVIALAITFFVLKKVRTLSGGTKKQRELAARLQQSGAKGRATIVAIQPTGTIVHPVNIGCNVHFSIEPLAGGHRFDGTKQMLLNQAAMPQVGAIWPCWYDPADPTQFAVGQPGGDARQSVAVFREFGIPHPLDPAGT